MQILYTKNPKCHGNAIIVAEYDPTENTLINYLNGRKMWIVESDFGNRMKLTDNEIDEYYNRGDMHDYQDWARDRMIAVTKPIRKELETLISVAEGLGPILAETATVVANAIRYEPS